MACGCPLLVYAPLMIPGQEEYNAQLLEREGAGMVTKTPCDLKLAVAELLQAPERIEMMRDCAKRLARPNAAAEITELLEAL